MASRAAVWVTVSLVLGLGVVKTEGQTVGCSSVQKPFVLNNLRNLSAGLSDITQLRDFALRPLINQERVSGSYGSSLARTHIKTWMTSMGWTVEEDAFTAPTPFGNVRFANVIATLNPNKPRRLVLACHYDTKYMPSVRFYGAIDSAVPCSLLLDAAYRLFSLFQTNKSTASDLTLQFIFFDGEEAFNRWSATDSLYGSRHLAEKWHAMNNLQGISTLILLDLIGTPDTHFKNRIERTTLHYQKLRDIELCLASNSLLKSTRNTVPLFTSQADFSVIEDDHIPFQRKGVPIVHLITAPFPSVWHQPSDNLYALDFDRIDNLARILRVYLADQPL